MYTRQLIVNADDLGLCSGVNQGILQAHREGIVTSATLMLNMEAAEEAIELARANPSLAVGLHLTLTAGRPLASEVASLIGPDGRFLRMEALAASARADELEREVRAQVAAFLATGLPLSHIDSHHHVHMQLPQLGPIVARVAAELSVPVRGGVGHFVSRFYGEAITPEALAAILHDLPEGLSELMCHPGRIDPCLARLSSYVEQRTTELATLTSPRVRAILEAEQIGLTTYPKGR